MPEICIFAPAGEPLHVEEAKLHSRVTDSVDNGLIRSLIGVARQAVESRTRQQCLHARWQLTLDQFPMGGLCTPLPFSQSVNIPAFAIRLPHSPLVRVVSIQYLDMNGSLQTMPTTDYTVNFSMMPAIITPKFGKVWPIALPQIGSVTVTYEAGYASPITASLGGQGTITVTGPVTYAVGDRVQFYGSGDMNFALPAPLSVDATYLVASIVSPGVYTLSDASGAPITLTSTGTGVGRAFIGVVPDGLRNWMLLRVGALYENREEVAVGQRIVVLELPYVDSLLDPFLTSLP